MEGAMNRMMSGVAEFVFGLAPSDIPFKARRDAALMCLDTLGVAAAAAPMEPADRAGLPTEPSFALGDRPGGF